MKTRLSQTTRNRLVVLVCMCALISGCEPCTVSHHFRDVAKGKAEHIGHKAGADGMITPTNRTTITFLTYFPTNASYDVVPFAVDGKALAPAFRYDENQHSSYTEFPAGQNAVSEVRFYAVGQYNAGQPNNGVLSRIHLDVDPYFWDDKPSLPQNGGPTFYVVWNPTTQAIVIMDDDLSGGAKN